MLEERRERLEKMRWMAQKAMLHAQVLMRQSKKKVTFAPYQKNQKVWLEATNLKTMHPSAKLAPRRYGPFTVKTVISPVVYQLDLPKYWKIHDVFHTSLLSPYKETTLHGPNYEEPPPDLIDDQPEWEVKAILDLRRFGRARTLQYRVRWKGYSDSWEPTTNVHAPDLVRRYYKDKGKAAVKSITPLVFAAYTLCRLLRMSRSNPHPATFKSSMNSSQRNHCPISSSWTSLSESSLTQVNHRLLLPLP